MKIKSICEIELMKKEYDVVDDLVRINKSIEIFDGCIFDYELHLVGNYLNKVATDKYSVVKFFQDAIENDIIKEKYWVSYLDIHMEYRYVEDGETLYAYEAENISSPLAIRGEEKEVRKFIKTVLFLSNEVEKDYGDFKNGIHKSIISRSKISKIIVNDFGGDLHKFAKYILKEINFANLRKDFADEETEIFHIDRAYYEQRPYGCPV